MTTLSGRRSGDFHYRFVCRRSRVQYLTHPLQFQFVSFSKLSPSSAYTNYVQLICSAPTSYATKRAVSNIVTLDWASTHQREPSATQPNHETFQHPHELLQQSACMLCASNCNHHFFHLSHNDQ